MPSFTSFTDLLPDPVHTIGEAGQLGDIPGPGFKSVSLKSMDSFIKSTVNSARSDTRNGAFHKWQIDISYNMVPRNIFDPLYTFLLHRKSTLEPFYIDLPDFNTQTPIGVVAFGGANKGADEIVVSVPAPTIPPQLFTIDLDPKVYMITRVETDTNFYEPSGTPGVGQERYHITPNLRTLLNGGETLDFVSSWFKVRQLGESIQYSIDSKNLYSFSLKLEEVV